MLNRAGAEKSGAPTLLAVTIGGKPVSLKDIFELSVEQEPNVIDMATISMSNISGAASESVKLQSPVVVTCNDNPIFTGEVMGMEPKYAKDRPSRLVIRAMNRMHRLTRDRQSRTYEKMTDQEIVTKVCGDVGLYADCRDTKRIRHQHVHRVSQTGLEFLNQRAALLDYELSVTDETLLFQPRDKMRALAGAAALSFRKGNIINFQPRMSLMNQVDEVVCRGWDPSKKEAIIATATAAAPASLPGVPADEVMPKVKKTVTLNLDWHGKTQEEAEALVKRTLQDRQMSFITGDVTCDGTADLTIGGSVDIDVPDSRFKGKYYVMGLCHRYVHDHSGAHSGSDAGFRTTAKVQRDRGE